MRRKAAGLLFVILAFSFIFFACSNEKPIKEKPKMLSVWTYYNGEQKRSMDLMLDKFNQSIGRDKGIIVKQESYASLPELNLALIDSAMGKAGSPPLPDMMITYMGIGLKIDSIKGLLDYRDYISEKDLDKIVDYFIEMGQDDDRLLMFPIVRSTEVLMLNDTSFSKFIEDTNSSYEDLKTFEGIRELAKKYYKYTSKKNGKDQRGLALYGVDSVENYFFSVLSQRGTELLSQKDGKTLINFSKEDARYVWDNYYDPMIRGHFAKYGKYTSSDVKSGRTLIGLSSTTGVPYFSDLVYDGDKEIPIDLKVFPPPHVKGGQDKFVVQGGGIFTTKSDKKTEEACIEFVKWLTNIENNSKFSIESSYLPVVKEAFSKDYIAEYSKNKGIDKKISDSLNLASDQFSTRQAYSPKPIEKYEEIRSLISEDFVDYCNNNVEKVNERIANGEDYKEVVGEYLSEKSFDNWYKDFMFKARMILEKEE